MDLLETMLKRRSIRQYSGEAIPQAKIDRILQAGLLAPSSRNRLPCEFIVVHDKDMLKKLSDCKASGSAMLADAYCAIVVLGDKEKSDVWVEDCSLALIYMQLMATELELGNCWVQCRLRTSQSGVSSEEYVRDLLSFPENFALEAILALGVPLNQPNPHSFDDLKISKLHNEKF